MLQNKAMVRSQFPNAGLANRAQRQYYNPYLTYQRSSLPYRFGKYGLNGYKMAQRPNTMATQVTRYPAYNQRRMLPMKTNVFHTAQRSNARFPFYRSSTVTSPYNPRLPYTRTNLPSHVTEPYRSPSLFRKPWSPPKAPMSLLASRAHVPVFQHSQIPHQPLYQPKWNLLGRNSMHKPAVAPNGMKFRRMAINNGGRAYNGLQSPRDIVAQKTPLPLPLASIMTAARIVVPARPNTLNGALKSNVESLPSADPEEKGARAV
jgi:hypothetical protein